MISLEALLERRPLIHGHGTRSWGIAPSLARFLDQHVQPAHVTLETGAGLSTLVIARKGIRRHIAIAPAQDEFDRIRASLISSWRPKTPRQGGSGVSGMSRTQMLSPEQRRSSVLHRALFAAAFTPSGSDLPSGPTSSFRASSGTLGARVPAIAPEPPEAARPHGAGLSRDAMLPPRPVRRFPINGAHGVQRFSERACSSLLLALLKLIFGSLTDEARIGRFYDRVPVCRFRRLVQDVPWQKTSRGLDATEPVKLARSGVGRLCAILGLCGLVQTGLADYDAIITASAWSEAVAAQTLLPGNLLPDAVGRAPRDPQARLSRSFISKVWARDSYLRHVRAARHS